MRRYSQVFLVVALFCFLFPFAVITPAKNSGTFQMTGWDMLSAKNIGISKQPPVELHIPLRVPILVAVLGGAAGILLKLTKKGDVAWVGAAATIVAAISLGTVTTSNLPVQLTDGQNVLYQFDSPPVQLLPAFYVSLGLMAAAVVSALMNLRAHSAVQSAAAVAARPAFAPANVSSPAVRASSFCTKCGGGLAAGAKFCNRCGSVVAASVGAKPPEVATPAAQQSAVRTEPSIATAPAAAPEIPTAPAQRPVTAAAPPTPAAPPFRVAFPQAVPNAAARSGLTTGAKLGFAAVALVFAVGIWFAVRPSTNHGASMRTTSVSISPATIRVVPGGTVRVMALVNGDDREVQWSVEEGSSGGRIEAGGATVQNGTVFLLGNYHAPYVTGIYHVTAVSAADQTQKATAQVIVSYGNSGRF